MRAIRKADDHVHLGAQFGIVAAVGELAAPMEAAVIVDADGREKD